MKAFLLALSLLFLLPGGVSDLIEQAEKAAAGQHYEQALEKALQALELSRGEADALGQVRSLSCIVGIDIMTSRDQDAWDKALEAEGMARSNGFREELSRILISKAKLCSYAEISPETGRNDEGLDYAMEALQLAEQTGDIEAQTEACYVIGSLYINKNRWSHPIDQQIYRLAGEYLERGQELSERHNLPRLLRNGLLFRSRWFQQGGRYQEAIRYFEQVKYGLQETDYLTASALDDRLVRLYTQVGEYQKALDTHDEYVFLMQKYIQQKQDETLQEMETRFHVHEKEREIERHRYRSALLMNGLLLAGAFIWLLAVYTRRIHRRNRQLEGINSAKEQIIDFLSKDLKSPTRALSDQIKELSAQAASLSSEELRAKCQGLIQDAQTINRDVAGYVEDVLMDRSRRIADIGLSKREIEIIRLCAQGMKAAEIAERCFISVHTVNTHRQRIYSKMEVKNVADMLRVAGELGII